jgi:hypothetical protein
MFCLETFKLGATFYMILDVSEQIERGRKPSGSTIKWWLQQSDAAKRVFHDQAKPAAAVLPLFAQWLKTQPNAGKGGPFVWGNGATFDISMLEDIYRNYKLPDPWGYNKAMDLRTFKRFIGEGAQIPSHGVAHNALDDAVKQAQYVMDQVQAKRGGGAE